MRQHTGQFFSVFLLFRCFVGCFGRRGSGPSQTRAQDGSAPVRWLRSTSAASEQRSQFPSSESPIPSQQNRLTTSPHPHKQGFSKNWLSEAIQDNALHLPGYQLFRVDRITELMGKMRGVGLCFHIN